MSGPAALAGQGRARTLYDEQLQRQQQEKMFRLTRRVLIAETMLIVPRESHEDPGD